jgi:primosomal protein N'
MAIKVGTLLVDLSPTNCDLLETLRKQCVEDQCDYCQRQFIWFRPMPAVCPTCGTANVRQPFTGIRETVAAEAQERAVATPLEFTKKPRSKKRKR